MPISVLIIFLLDFSHFVTLLDTMKGKLKQSKHLDDLQTVQILLNDPRFKSAIKVSRSFTLL